LNYTQSEQREKRTGNKEKGEKQGNKGERKETNYTKQLKAPGNKK